MIKNFYKVFLQKSQKRKIITFNRNNFVRKLISPCYSFYIVDAFEISHVFVGITVLQPFIVKIKFYIHSFLIIYKEPYATLKLANTYLYVIYWYLFYPLVIAIKIEYLFYILLPVNLLQHILQQITEVARVKYNINFLYRDDRTTYHLYKNKITIIYDGISSKRTQLPIHVYPHELGYFCWKIEGSVHDKIKLLFIYMHLEKTLRENITALQGVKIEYYIHTQNDVYARQITILSQRIVFATNSSYIMNCFERNLKKIHLDEYYDSTVPGYFIIHFSTLPGKVIFQETHFIEIPTFGMVKNSIIMIEKSDDDNDNYILT